MEPQVTQANRRVASDAHREKVDAIAKEYVARNGHDYDVALERAEAAAAKFPNALREDVATLLRRRATTVAGLPQRGLHV